MPGDSIIGRMSEGTPTPASDRPQPARDNALLLRDFLQENDAPCPVCGYNLRQLTGNVCPECGQPFKLQVGAVHVQFGQFLLFLSPMLMTAGVGLFFAGVILFNGAPPRNLWGVWALMFAGIVEAPATILVYRYRTLFQKQPKPRQYALVYLAWLVHIAFVALCFTLGWR
jgi:hypothetical protein